MQMAFSGSRTLGDLSDSDFQKILDNTNKTKSRFNQLGIGENNSNSPSSNGASGGLFGSNSSGSNGALGNFLGGNFSLDSMTDRAKDMARFRLGLDQEQAGFFGGLREKEAQSNFGRQTSFEKQQQEGRESLTNITQNALTGRLDRELQNRLTQQDRNIGQQNLATNRAINLASRRLGQ